MHGKPEGALSVLIFCWIQMSQYLEWNYGMKFIHTNQVKSWNQLKLYLMKTLLLNLFSISPSKGGGFNDCPPTLSRGIHPLNIHCKYLLGSAWRLFVFSHFYLKCPCFFPVSHIFILLIKKPVALKYTFLWLGISVWCGFSEPPSPTNSETIYAVITYTQQGLALCPSHLAYPSVG